MISTGFWDCSPVSDLSDLDVAWSPNSSGSLSDQENHYNYFSCSQQLHSPASSTSTGASSPAKRNKCPAKRLQQRSAANQRERKRMRTINEAFEGLRERIPLAGGDRKLSKVDTLRLAIRYIHQLAEMVDSVGNSACFNSTKHQEEKAKVIIRCHGIQNMDCSYEQYAYTEDPSTCSMSYPLYGHSLSWEDVKQPKYGPNNRLSAKVWTPEVDTSITSISNSSYTDTDFTTL